MEKFHAAPNSRRAVLGSLLALAAPGAVHAAARRKAPLPPPLVTVLGDSITAGLGLTQDRALPAWLQRTLDAMKIQARVFGFGAIGDTTRAGLSRVERIPPETAVCVVALGGNDLLQGADRSRPSSWCNFSDGLRA
jgi:acyl-CoA thioesterase-1